MSFDSRETSVYDGQPVECFQFTRGESAWLLTSADVAITLPGVGVFEPSAIEASGRELREDSEQDGIELLLPRTSEIIAPFISFHPSEVTWVRVYRVHRGDEDYPRCIFFGAISNTPFTRDGSIARVQCASLLSLYQRRVPGLAYTAQCNRVLYGPGCDLDPEDFKGVLNVSSFSGSEITSPGLSLFQNGYFTAGLVQRANGERRFITLHDGYSLYLMSPFTEQITPGESVTAYAGCPLTRAACIEKFDNVAKFLGFEWIPTKDPHVQRIGSG